MSRNYSSPQKPDQKQKIRIISQSPAHLYNHNDKQNLLKQTSHYQQQQYPSPPKKNNINITKITYQIIQDKGLIKEIRSISQKTPNISIKEITRPRTNSQKNDLTQDQIISSQQQQDQMPQYQNPQLTLKQQQFYNQQKEKQQTQQNKPKFNIQPLQQQSNEEKIQTEQSRPSTAQLQCFYCKLSSKQDFIFLPCLHQFHDACFKKLLNSQLDQQSAIIKCLCNKRIPQQTCRDYFSPLQFKIYFQIQAQFLPKQNQDKHKWKRCPNHGCDYLFIEKPQLSSKGMQIKCPNCLVSSFGKTIKFPKL